MIKRVKSFINRAKIKDEKYLYLLNETKDSDEIVSLDLETTGLNPKKDEILSIGAVKIKDNRVLINESFEAFVKPKGDISSQSIKIHHIRPCDLDDALDIKDAITSLIDFIGNRKILGYYIKFDFEFINRYIKEITGIKLPNETIELSSYYFKRKRRASAYEFVDLKFDTILRELDIPQLYKHDALNDAVMTAMMFIKLKTIPEYRGAFS